MVDAQRDLQEADDARRALQVADVGLGGTHRQRVVAAGIGADGRAQCRGLDGVTDRRAGAVEFDVLHLGRGHARVVPRQPQHLLLGSRAGHRQAVRGAVVVDGAATDHAVHAVAVALRLVQRLQDDQAAALAPYVAVGARVERVAAAVGRQAAELRRADRALRHQVEADAAGEREHRLAAPQALAGHVHRDQGGGLGRVDRDARAVETEGVGDAVGDDAALESRQGVPVDGLGPAAPGEGGVVVADGAGEDAGAGVPEAGGQDPGVLQGLPAQLQHQPLLRVHGRGLARGDAEERRVEPAHLVQVAAAAGGRLARGVGVGVVPRLGVPAVARRLADRVHPLAEDVPEGAGVRGPGKPAGEADHGDRNVLATEHARGLGFGLTHIGLHGVHPGKRA